MIKDLETKGLRLHQEKQTFVDQLQQEANALREEIDKNEVNIYCSFLFLNDHLAIFYVVYFILRATLAVK